MEDVRLNVETRNETQSTTPDIILNCLGEPVFCCDESGNCLYGNKEFWQLLNQDGEVDQDTAFPNLFSQNDGDLLFNLLKYAVKYVFASYKTEEIEYRKKDGNADRFYLIKIQPVLRAEGEQPLAVIRIADISQKKQIEVAAARKEALFDQTQKIVNICHYAFDFTNNTWESSPQLCEIFGIDKNYPHTQESFFLLLNQDWREALEDCTDLIGSEQKRFDYEYKISRMKDGAERWVRGLGQFIYDKQERLLRLIGTFEDITERKKKEEELIYLSYHDKLTGLYNRRFYEEELKRMDSERNLPISVIIGDVNGLKLMNETYGHKKGDQLLKEIADMLLKVCRSNDVVARWGGDEFVILLPKTSREETEKIIKRIKDQYVGKQIGSVAINIAFGWQTKESADEDMELVFKQAENNMYNNKVMESSNIHNNNIFSIINSLNDKKPNEREHSLRVGELCRSIGICMGFSEIDVDILALVGFLHDIGEICVEGEILNKPGKLTEPEMEQIKRHPEVGYRLIKSCYHRSELADFILAHHERWDGLGYPKGLQGEQIPKIARIIAIADSFDAMTNERLYKETLTEEEAVEEIIKHAGSQFDPHIARIFVEKVLGKSWDRMLDDSADLNAEKQTVSQEHLDGELVDMLKRMAPADDLHKLVEIRKGNRRK